MNKLKKNKTSYSSSKEYDENIMNYDSIDEYDKAIDSLYVFLFVCP